jgi:hypothetical protein
MGVETGGILMGRPANAATVVITRVSPPGPLAVHRRTAFSRDTRFLQRYLDAIPAPTAPRITSASGTFIPHSIRRQAR